MKTPAKSNADYPVLILLDQPDGTRTSFFARGPAQVRFGETYVIFESSLEWATGDEDQSRSPIPANHRMVVHGTGTLRTSFNVIIEKAPWVVYCRAVPT